MYRVLTSTAGEVQEPSRREGSGHLAAPVADNLVGDVGTDSLAESGHGMEGLQRSTSEMSVRVLGPVQNDDDADLRIALRETNGVERQWGAGNIAADRRSNWIEGNTELVDATGFRHHVVAAPFYPDWPGV